jgi:phospholipid transport system substrate-binding protein
MLIRRLAVLASFLATFLTAASIAPAAYAQIEAPDALVKRVSTDVLDSVKADPSIQAGDVDRIVALVDDKILPNFDFDRMTASATGPRWNEATPEQKKALETQFEMLLIRVYSGALADARDRTITLRPFRGRVTDPEVVVRTEVTGGGDPIELDFRMVREDATWKITDLNVGGVWLVDNYRSTFAQEITNGGIAGLIARLKEKNQAKLRS